MVAQQPCHDPWPEFCDFLAELGGMTFWVGEKSGPLRVDTRINLP